MIEPTTTSNQITMSYKSKDIPNISKHHSNEDCAMSQGKKNYEDLVTCPVCYDMFSNVNEQRLPKVLPCQHTFCVECISIMLLKNKESKQLTCPICKFCVDSIQDASSLPTNRIVISLLEKESLDYQGFAACPNCKQIRHLEVCFECHSPLCRECVSKHYDQWKTQINTICLQKEENLEIYRRKIDSMGHLLTKNFENSKKISEDIESTFNGLIKRLETEKALLLSKIDEIISENNTCFNLKNETAALIAGFRVFRELNDSYEKTAMTGRIRKYQLNCEQANKLEQEFQNITKQPFKILEGLDKDKQIIHLNNDSTHLLGQISTSEYLIEKNVLSPPLSSSMSSVNKAMVQEEPSRTSEPVDQYEAVQFDLNSAEDSLVQFASKSKLKSQFEHSIKFQTNYMAAHQHLLFCLDENSNLHIYEKLYQSEFKLKNSLRLNLPYVTCLAVNANYLVYSYIGLKKEQLKKSNKIKLPPVGIALHRRDQHIVCSVHDKLIDQLSDSTDHFMQPTLLALNDHQLFVYDKELSSLFRFDLTSNSASASSSCSLVQSMPLEFEASAMSANNHHLVLTSSIKSCLYLIECDTLRVLRRTTLRSPSSPYELDSCLITSDNLIFVKLNDSQFVLMDLNQEIRATFNEIPARIRYLFMMRDSVNQLFVAVSQPNLKQSNLMGYIN